MNTAMAVKLAGKLGFTVLEDLDHTADPKGLCVYWKSQIRLNVDLVADQKLHVLIHEICHATGTADRLNRDSLTNYASHKLHQLVEETIVEMATVVLLTAMVGEVNKNPLSSLLTVCEDEGIEIDHDIQPEVERILDYLGPKIKELVK